MEVNRDEMVQVHYDLSGKKIYRISTPARVNFIKEEDIKITNLLQLDTIPFVKDDRYYDLKDKVLDMLYLKQDKKKKQLKEETTKKFNIKKEYFPTENPYTGEEVKEHRLPDKLYWHPYLSTVVDLPPFPPYLKPY